MANVILLRSPSQHDSPDPYEETFRSFGYNAFSVPVLETTLTNLHELALLLRQPPSARGHSGVIITSARACAAWKAVATDLDLQQAERSPSDNPQVLEESTTGSVLTHRVSCVFSNTPPTEWASLPFYVVGNATAEALGSIRHDIHVDSRLAPTDIRGAAEAGTSERLARFILEDVVRRGDNRAATQNHPKLPLLLLLYLTGDKNRDTLPSILQEAGVPLESLQVYETVFAPSFAADLEAAVKKAACQGGFLFLSLSSFFHSFTNIMYMCVCVCISRL